MGFQKKEGIVREEKDRTEGFGSGRSPAWTAASLLSSLPVNQIVLPSNSALHGFPVNLERR